MSAEVNYQSEYYAADYPNKHPYFRYIVSKYEPLLESHERYRDMLFERLKYLDSIDASWEEQKHVKNQIDNVIAYSYEIYEEFIWSDDEQDLYNIADRILLTACKEFAQWVNENIINDQSKK